MNNTETLPTTMSTTLNTMHVTEHIITAVSDAKGVAPEDVQPPLAAVVDPDALNRLVTSMIDSFRDQPATVEFTYSGYRVTILIDGTEPTVDVARQD